MTLARAIVASVALLVTGALCWRYPDRFSELLSGVVGAASAYVLARGEMAYEVRRRTGEFKRVGGGK